MLAFLLPNGTFVFDTASHQYPLCKPDRKETLMKIGILIGVIVAALLVGFSFVKEEAPSGSVKDNFGNNWAR